MNLLFVTDVSISKVIGGAERVLFEQVSRLAKRGHSVFIMTRRLPNQKSDQEVIQHVREYRYDCNSKNPLLFLSKTYANSKKIFEILHKKKMFDCINFHQSLSSLGVIHSSLSSRIPKIYTCHSLSFEEFISRNGNENRFIPNVSSLIKTLGYKLIEKEVLQRSDSIITLSKFTKNKIITVHKILKNKIQVIPGGVNLNKFALADDKNKIRKQLNIPQNKVVLFTVRNLVQRMGLDNLIIAFNNLIKRKIEIHLVIGGEGVLQDGLIALTRSFGIDDHIHFAGFIPEEQLPAYYQMADLFVLPSMELEGFGLVTLEAMACGLPVLGTPVGGTKEIIGNFDPSFLSEGTDPHSMAELILKKYYIIKNNPQRWKEISNHCRKFVENNYSWEKNINALERVFVNANQK